MEFIYIFYMHVQDLIFDAIDTLKDMFFLQFYTVCCSIFGALKSHDLSPATSVHVRVIVDSMGLGEGGWGRTLSHIPRLEIKSIDLHIY